MKTCSKCDNFAKQLFVYPDYSEAWLCSGCLKIARKQRRRQLKAEMSKKLAILKLNERNEQKNDEIKESDDKTPSLEKQTILEPKNEGKIEQNGVLNANNDIEITFQVVSDSEGEK